RSRVSWLASSGPWLVLMPSTTRRTRHRLPTPPRLRPEARPCAALRTPHPLDLRRTMLKGRRSDDGRLGVGAGDPPPDALARIRDGAYAAAPRRYGLDLTARPERALVDSVSSGRLSVLRWTSSPGPRPANIRLIDRRTFRVTW